MINILLVVAAVSVLLMFIQGLNFYHKLEAEKREVARLNSELKDLKAQPIILLAPIDDLEIGSANFGYCPWGPRHILIENIHTGRRSVVSMSFNLSRAASYIFKRCAEQGNFYYQGSSKQARHFKLNYIKHFCEYHSKNGHSISVLKDLWDSKGKQR